MLNVAIYITKSWPSELLCYPASGSGDGIYSAVSFGQNVALVMVNKFVKFDMNSLHFVKVVAEIC